MQNCFRAIGIVLFSFLLVFAAAYELPLVKQIKYQILYLFDSRPAIDILFIGNSRTYTNDMPYMVRTIAESAHTQKNYRITMYAPGGTRFEDHWNNSKVHELLKKKWDYVVLQGGSDEQLDESRDGKFRKYGEELAALVKANGAKPVFFVAWRYSPGYPFYPELPTIYPQLYDRIQMSYAQVAQTTGASTVNVGKVWEQVLIASPKPLTVDGNHPNIRGSYLAALMFYRFFSGDDLSNVTYVPNGMSPEDANLLKSAAQSW